MRKHLLGSLAYSLALLTLTSCAVSTDDDAAGDGEGKFDSLATSSSGLGAAYSNDGKLARFRVKSAPATRVEVYLYAKASGEDERAKYEMTRDAKGVWSVEVPVSELTAAGLSSTVFYGYRAWGPNWTSDSAWTKGSSAGFKSDVDAAGNRFNPNKLLLDPYAIEMSHDPVTPSHLDGTVYASGPAHRTKDSGRVAPKGVLVKIASATVGPRPSRPLKDEVIYEVHVRGLTMNDPSIASELRGTYAGAAQQAAYLKSVGVTAVEFLPVQETQNDQNDIAMTTNGANYWGYMTLNYFAPDRRYAADKSPGGPTREFKQMVRAFHDQGIKVYIDVVYNHTGEGGLWDGTGDVANVLSFRGLDNAGYYELTGGNRFSWDNTGVGGNFNTANDTARDLIIDSLRYWHQNLGVDGFRFDLASVLGNSCQKDCWNFDKLDPKNSLNRAVRELPVRPDGGGIGVDLIAEPWAIGDGTYQVGNFPSGWAEWNGKFRDTFRKVQNKLGVENVTPGELATRIAGSSDLYGDDGRKPWHSVNFIVAHDGFTLRDLYAYNSKNNNQPWPYGPSDGGEDHNVSWDQGNNVIAQRQAARTGLAMLMLSAGVPMINGGDELYRTQYGNNNAYNLDSSKNWIDFSGSTSAFADFARRIIAFRTSHPALRPAKFFRGADGNSNGVKDITWYRDNGAEADGAYMDNPSMHFLAYRIDGTELGDSAKSIYVAYNAWSGQVTATLPALPSGRSWYRVADTAAWMESRGNAVNAGQEERMGNATYDLAGRSVLVLIEK
ncbi:MAG: isoamylase [Myxococcota bacterium]|nr:isoamylase [Myxococcota bacterium]